MRHALRNSIRLKSWSVETNCRIPVSDYIFFNSGCQTVDEMNIIEHHASNVKWVSWMLFIISGCYSFRNNKTKWIRICTWAESERGNTIWQFHGIQFDLFENSQQFTSTDCTLTNSIEIKVFSQIESGRHHSRYTVNVENVCMKRTEFSFCTTDFK